MLFSQTLLPGTFVRWLNRFAALVELEGEPVQAHVANSGRLAELFGPGNPVYLAPAAGLRQTSYDLQLVRLASGLVSADARLPNALVAEALSAGRLAPFAAYAGLRREFVHGDCRFDLCLNGAAGATCLVEVKSITLVEDGGGRFPDAPTLRGRRHVETLTRVAQAGGAVAVVFVIQREDARYCTPHDEVDPAFGAALRAAAAAGVQVLAYRCAVSLEGVELTEPVPMIW